MSSVIEREIHDGVALVRLNRPHARNAVSREVHRALDAALDELDQDPSVRAIILTGADPAFSGGVDIKELRAHPEVAGEIGPRIRPLIDTSTPVIGAINGAAFTGGLELALNCHFLIASERASFADTHVRLGLTPGWGLTVLLAEAIGSRRARQMITSCEPIDASTALTWGLVNEVTSHESLLPRAREIAHTIASNDRTAVSTIVHTMDEQRTAADAEQWAIEARNWIDPSTPGSRASKG